MMHACTRRAAITAALGFVTASRAQDGPPRLDAPYVPTPWPVVDKMLEMGRVGRRDVVYDLGCGDGRIVITAAKTLGARGVGIDLDPVRIDEARTEARNAGVAERVKFEVGDLFQADFSEASVVTLYLLPQVNLALRPQLWRQLKVGSRVVSHAFDMGEDWPPKRTERVITSTLYQWTISSANKAALRKGDGDHPPAKRS